mgnify:CR=1 FL=1|tara:strand:- start:4985 stop:6739 length:1755 start_codon:yes stop_codon:yes gene_type:complete
MSVLDKLTEGIVNRDLQKEGAALLNKWEKTGLLEGLDSDNAKDGMARLLENQAKELLREASAMQQGDVEGFASVAFPIVRRVFGNLIANDLVSVQPMSLPSGLIFFLDFTVDDDRPSPAKPGYAADSSLYGGGVVGQELTGGVDLTGANLEAGPYSLNNGYSSPTGSTAKATSVDANTIVAQAGGADDDLDRALDYDPDVSGSVCGVIVITGSADLAQMDLKNLVALGISAGAPTGVTHRRRLTKIHSGSTGNTYDPQNTNLKIQLAFEGTGSTDSIADQTALIKTALDAADLTITFPIVDNFTNSTFGNPGGVVGTTDWGLEQEADIPEINIKVDSVAVTAQTKKLKAKWTPELGQDLNAYHNLDAEVELTSILSEQIALELDREILEDLIKGATAGTQYWSRRPGRFLVRDSGAQVGVDQSNESLMGADFTGTVSEWYETLAETINDVSAQIHRKTLRGGANFVVCSPEVANILEFTAGFRASIGNDYGNGSVGAVNVGSLSKKFDVYVDPYFPRNVILVGRKGGSFLESGYVYAPYVPLQVTPTIFGVEDFVPRKGVMTRYAKKMVRPDMYGLVICRDLLG